MSLLLLLLLLKTIYCAGSWLVLRWKHPREGLNDIFAVLISSHWDAVFYHSLLRSVKYGTHT